MQNHSEDNQHKETTSQAKAKSAVESEELLAFEKQLAALLNDSTESNDLALELRNAVLWKIDGRSPNQMNQMYSQLWLNRVCAIAAMVLVVILLFASYQKSDEPTGVSDSTEMSSMAERPRALLYEEKFSNYQESNLDLSNVYFGSLNQ